MYNLNKFMSNTGIENTMNASIKGIFLLILTVASNFNAETLGCRAQKFLAESMFGKHILNLALIYFAINLTDNEDTHPNIILKRTLVVWIGYLLFIRLPLNVTLFVFCLLMVVYTLGNYIDYYKKKEINSESDNEIINENYKKMVSIRNILFNVIIVSLIIGSLVYTYLKKEEYGEEFDLITFIFGRNDCKSIISNNLNNSNN